MKYRISVPRLATLVAGSCLFSLAASAAPQMKTSFTETEVVAWVNFGTALTDGTHLLLLNATGNGVTTGSDPRVEGASIITASAAWDMQQLGPLWGSYRKNSPGGTWEGYFVAVTSLENGHYVMTETNVAVGGGGYQGLVLRKTGRSVDRGPVYYTGYIVQGGPGDLPLRWSELRVDRLQMVGGMILDPITFQPTGQLGMLGVGSIVSGVGEMSHTGRETNAGVGLFDLATGAGSAMGTWTTANGDLLHWVSTATTLGTGVNSVSVHFVGGTGLLDDATGGFGATYPETITPTADPMVFRGSFTATANGTIRYSAPATIRK